MSQVLATPRPPLVAPAVARALMPLGLGLIILGLLFRVEIGAAINVALGNPAYNHCFIIIPLVGYLIWERRSALIGMVPRPWLAPALLAGSPSVSCG